MGIYPSVTTYPILTNPDHRKQAVPVRMRFSLIFCALICAVRTELIPDPGYSHVKDQIQRLRQHGYEVSHLDGHTQLRVFLNTWLAMERGEDG